MIGSYSSAGATRHRSASATTGAVECCLAEPVGASAGFVLLHQIGGQSVFEWVERLGTIEDRLELGDIVVSDLDVSMASSRSGLR
jgi:hypothetical protein